MKEIYKWLTHLKDQRKELECFLQKETSKNNIQGFSRLAFSQKLEAKSLKELRVACIADDFTLNSYKPECNLFELTPQNWKEEIDFFNPELVFIESAWCGKDSLWYKKISNGSAELYQMTTYCHEKRIPVVFWNKEDPIHNNVFLFAAKCADFVFTTDIDYIEIYKKTLEHDNVYFLHFAAQPRLHNPVEKYNRKDRFCFAGSYYHYFPERSRTFDAFAEVFKKTKGFDIYDRYLYENNPKIYFPESYRPYILGTLGSKEMDVAYKGYYYGINMNSVSQSQTMLARRVFEMLASNTVTIGNYSLGAKNLFGDLTICTNSEQTLKRNLEDLCNTLENLKKYRLLGLRKVLSEHLYEDRLDYIVQKVFGVSLKRKPPVVMCIAVPSSSENLAYVLRVFNKQTYQNKKLLLVGDFPNIKDEEVIQVSPKNMESTLINEILSEGYFGLLKEDNYYGENYLTDLTLTLRYISTSGIGKAGYYVCKEGTYSLISENKAYRYVTELKTDRSIFAIDKYKRFTVADFIRSEALFDESFFSIDEFHFCQGLRANSCPTVDDAVVHDQGIPIFEIEKVAESVRVDFNRNAFVIPVCDLLRGYHSLKESSLRLSINDGHVRFNSTLEDEKPRYLWLKNFYEVERFQKGGNIGIQIIGIGDLNVRGAFFFYDEQKRKIGKAFSLMLNRFVFYEVPKDAKYFKIGLRIFKGGVCDIRKIVIGLEKTQNKLTSFLSRSDVIVLTNLYPSPDDLYRNMFVHKRISSYKKEGYLCDVVRMHIRAEDGFREFEGINVVEGHAELLRSILTIGRINTVCVHFLDQDMWNVLKLFTKKLKIIIWIHGFEIQPSHRRLFNYSSDEEIEKAKQQSEEREKLWKEVFAAANTSEGNLHFVFVSNYLANEVFTDYGLKLEPRRYSIIHNYIDEEIFSYQQKTPQQRKNILSICPYKGMEYAYDLTEKCINELAKREFFNELSFMVVGDGDNFYQFTDSLKKFPNVILEKRFLKHEEIANLHKSCGIFMTPTRWDSHGVSMGEAMSSGLVPVTNAVASTPEFVDKNCAILAAAEDYLEMANGVEKLYRNPELFEKMSENAAKRVHNQFSKTSTIDREIDLIWPGRKVLGGEGEI